ncbi:MAG: immunity 26/phosphotriesterase HocA family protein [Myxococcota bacterium]|jgi:hypothetical protein|nr:immunity 26/phosphotriesterase HocA family protein [Myxococcota bacterium]
MTQKRKIKRTVGDVIAIPLGDGIRFGYGLVLKEPLVAFFDFCCDSAREITADEVVLKPVAFKIWVMYQPIVDGTWPVIGNVDVPEHLKTQPWFFKTDPISKKTTVLKTGNEEFSPEPGQAETLERAAVWSAEHVTDRLRDHFDGVANKWVDLLKFKTQ